MTKYSGLTGGWYFFFILFCAGTLLLLWCDWVGDARAVKVNKEEKLSDAPCGKATIVTAYFPLQTAKHSRNEYDQWIFNLCSLQDPTIIFAPKAMSTFFRDCRRKYRNDNKTLFIPFEIDDMKVVKKFGSFFWDSQLEIDPEGPLGEGVHKTSSLYKVWNEKTHFLKIGADLNPFGSEFFAWVDAGYHREVEYNGSTMISKLPTNLSDDQVIMLTIGVDGIGANFFGGSKPGIDKWHSAYYFMLEKRITSKNSTQSIFVSEWERQKMMGYCARPKAKKRIRSDDCHKFIGKEQITMMLTCQEHPELCYLVQPYQNFEGNPWFFMTHFLNSTTEFLPRNFSRSPFLENSTCAEDPSQRR